MTNNLPEPTPDNGPRTPEDFSRLFDAIVLATENPKDYDISGTLWCNEKSQPVSGMKSGLPWLGESPMQFKDIASLRKAAKDFLFYFDHKPKISLCVGVKAPPTKKRKSEFREVLYIGTIPWQIIDEI
jgi:hypothetical protein